MIFTIDEGQHRSTPLKLRPFVRKIEGRTTFIQPMYDLNSVDQADWNKLVGISFNPLKPDQHAIMIGWRYNLTTNKVEVGPYFNIDSSRETPERIKSGWLEVNPIMPVAFQIDYNKIKVWNMITGQYIVQQVPSNLRKRFWTSFLIQPWFGGNQVAPNNISIDLDYEIN